MKQASKAQECLLLIDGSSLLHRAFYALPLLSNRDGVFTNAVHGFMMMLNRLLAQQKPSWVIVCFDKSRITFRNDLYADYKGTRVETPSELKGQFELVKSVLDCAGIRWLEKEGYEADDLLGTLAKQGAAQGVQVEIFTGDRDIFQLADENTTIFLTRKGISEIERYDVAAVLEKYGVTPPHLADLKGLMGDSSDNIPGVAGVGEKTAIKLLSEYGDLETLYENIDAVSGVKLKEKLLAGKDAAFTSRLLATICTEVPLEISFTDCPYDANRDTSELAALYTQLGLQQLLRGLKTATVPAAASEWEDKPWSTAAEDAAAEAPAAQALALYPAGQMGLLLDQGSLVLAPPGAAPLRLSLPEQAAQLREYQPLLEDAAVKKFSVGAKECRNLLCGYGISAAAIREDVVIAAYLLAPTRGDYLLPDLLAEYGFAVPNTAEQQILLLPDLMATLHKQLAEVAQLDLYTDIEMPLVQVLSDMELAGIRVNGEQLAVMSARFAEACATYQAEIYALAGHEFNLNSPKQLGVVLFEEMGLPPLKKTKTGYSTDAEVLETLALTQPIAEKILDYRVVAKLHSTYTEGLQKLIAEDGKIHTSFMQTVTATGRLSSVEPNLQNIPVRHELGRQIRTVFTADGAGDLLLAADYNQIELRVLAHISGDQKLIEAFCQGEDIHTRTAAEVLGADPSAITPVQRRAAKAVNFGIVYGISDYGLSRDLGISRKEAEDYISKYFSRYPGVQAYQTETIAKAAQTGYVETLFGRRRYLPDLQNRNYNLRSFAERMAINAPIQGTAADIIKLAMVKIQQLLKAQGLSTKMLLQVHDELIFNVPQAELETVRKLVKENMEQAAALAVPLLVDVKVGQDWYHMEPLV